MTTSRWQLLVSGTVQGVYYRASTEQKARQLCLTGQVRNLPDGRVEIIAEGDEEQLQALKAWCQQGPERAVVEHIETRELTATGEFTSFRTTR
ncbi:acylphosphatase [Marinobacter sp. VGCF2001]|uniref:acylphosphatase n=1 Tax=Marinobacter sp. VGCF2001 TaxID=3417189 RepID=UPI003CF0F38F